MLHHRFKIVRVNVAANRQAFRNVEACHANATVGHPVIDVEAIGCTKIVAADLEPLPGRIWSRQTVMRSELAKAQCLSTLQGSATIRDPDALLFNIRQTFSTERGDLFRASAGKKRTMEHTQLQLSGGVRYRDREQACVFVIYITQFNAVPMSVSRKPEAMPLE